jgi:3-phenylpropionate/trans-cinnamate dioxygenase ferredoxin reductase component
MGGVVIIGAGQAGLQLAASLREAGYRDQVRLIGDEAWQPYQRPPLSKAFLTGAVDEQSLFMQEPGYFEEQRIEFVPGERVTTLHRELRQVDCASGKSFHYDHLVFATGARNRTLPCAEGSIRGVLDLRTLDDARHVKFAIEAARRVAIIGAGFLGLEAATIAAALGTDVSVVEAGPRVLARAVSAHVSQLVQQAHEAAGTGFRFSDAVIAIHGTDGAVQTVELESGEQIAADLVLVAIGVIPNDHVAAASGLLVHNGIIVDRRLRTEDPAVSAIGDCASFPYAADHHRMVRLESVQNAVDQARCVAERIVGSSTDYDRVPLFWSDQAGLRLQIAGLASDDEDAVIRPGASENSLSVFRFTGERLAAVESVNRLPDHMLARRLLGGGVNPTREQAADPNFDLKSLLVQASAP